MFKTKGLTVHEAIGAARAAAVVSGQPHVAYQGRNGRWKWGRAGWVRMLVLQRHSRLACWYIYGRDGLASTGVQGGSYASFF